MTLEINRTDAKFKRWIFQKNISGREQIIEFLKAKVAFSKDNGDSVRNFLKLENVYKGRSENGSSNTMGVRQSEIEFLMLGYLNNQDRFILTELGDNLITNNGSLAKSGLVSLFSIQYPTVYSSVDSNCFNVFAGRIIINLLLSEELEQKLYVDEMIYFLPFIRRIDSEGLKELTKLIKKFRVKSYDEKMKLIMKIPNWEHLFANTMHEFYTYFYKIYNGLGVVEKYKDADHNEGKLMSFHHGNGSTYRSDAFGKTKSDKFPTYIKLSQGCLLWAKALATEYGLNEQPVTPYNSENYSISEWKQDLYEANIAKYEMTASSVDEKKTALEVTLDYADTLVYESVNGNVTGKSFEKAINNLMNAFEENVSSDIVSGAGNPDVVTEFKLKEGIKKIDFEAKSRGSINNMDAAGIASHQRDIKSAYSVVVAPKFARRNVERMNLLSDKANIVGIDASTLANFVRKQCFYNAGTRKASFETLNNILIRNFGRDASDDVQKFIDRKYGLD